MNINEFMKRMRKAQDELSKKQDLISKKEFSISKQGVVIKVLGTKEIVDISIDSDLLDPEDSESLEMVLKSALNEVFAQIDKEFAALEAALGANMPF